MELQLADKGFDYVRKHKKWILILCVVGFGAYKVYHAPPIARKRKKLSKLLAAMVSVAKAISESADTIGIVSRDIKGFLQSDSDQVPNSLKQIFKIARSEHLTESLVSVTRAVTVGVLRGYQSMNPTHGNQSGFGSTFADQVLNKMFTPAGSGFASVVIGSFARNLVFAFYSDHHQDTHFAGESNSSNTGGGARHGGSNSISIPTWVDVVCGDRCGELIANCVQLFVSSAVAVYLDKTMHINTYDDFFVGLTNPKHETRVRDMFVYVCNSAVETLIKTSHQVLTSSNANVGSGSTSYLAIDEDLGVGASSIELRARDVYKENDNGWVSKVSSTLAVPSNRRLVLNVTGRVTFETIRSFMEFLLQTFCASLRRCVDIVHEAVFEIMRYIAPKSFVIVTICLSLCLHIMGGTWALVPT
ncbi:hypothetical protein RJT34_05640 [Clitoria ternatea]|uniref:Protein PHLOEM PROTEIN 2-LIKE A10 n=1 Tax=Clitoria ternatea TaxID=43366 RepID=A0AAN9PTT0_CLITE